MQLHYLLKTLILPPSSLLLIALLGLLLVWRWRRLGATLLAGSLLALWLLATPRFGGVLLEHLGQQYPAVRLSAAQGAQAIVVLGGGQYAYVDEYDGPALKPRTLERLYFGAFLNQRTGLPVLVSGGRVYDSQPHSEAEQMAALLRVWDVSEVWQEDRSRTTWENAYYSAELLRDKGVSRVLLVTNNWHLPRAVWSFRQAGIDVVPAGIGYSREGEEADNPWLAWVPSAGGLWASYYACHEWLGLLMYRLEHS